MLKKWGCVAGALCLLCLCACQQTVRPEELPTFETTLLEEQGCQTMTELATDNYPIPDGILIQSVLINEAGEESGYRIYQDGRYESKTANTAWTVKSPFTEQQVDKVKSAVEAAQLFDLPTIFQDESIPAQRTVLWFQMIVNGKQKEIVVKGNCEVPALNEFNSHLLEIFKQ